MTDPRETTVKATDPGEVTLGSRPHKRPDRRKRKRPITAEEFEEQAEELEAAARKLRTFAAWMRKVEIPELEFDGANAFETEIKEQLKGHYRRTRAALCGHPNMDDHVLKSRSE